MTHYHSLMGHKTTGQQIGLMLMASDKDFTLWPEPGAVLSIDLDATSLTLPLVGGEAALRNAFGQ